MKHYLVKLVINVMAERAFTLTALVRATMTPGKSSRWATGGSNPAAGAACSCLLWSAMIRAGMCFSNWRISWLECRHLGGGESL